MKDKIKYRSKNIHYPCGCYFHVSRKSEPNDCEDFEWINIESQYFCDKHSVFTIEEPRCSKCAMPFNTWKQATNCKHEPIIIPTDIREKLDKIIERNKTRQ